MSFESTLFISAMCSGCDGRLFSLGDILPAEGGILGGAEAGIMTNSTICPGLSSATCASALLFSSKI